MTGGDGSRRALSPVVGLVLLAGMVFVAATLVAIAGGGLLESVQDQTTVEHSVTSSRTYADQVEGRGYGVVEAPPETQTYADPDAGSMEIEVGNRTYLNETLGAVYQETGETTVAYQGGGVWRSEAGDATVRERAPPISYQRGSEPTLSITVITVQADGTTSSVDRLSANDSEYRYPRAHDDNPIVNESVTITVDSEFYRGWGTYFEQRLGANVSYAPDEQRMVAQLDGARRNDTTSHLYEGSGVPHFVYNDGTGLDVANDVTLDSYDSRLGPYDPNDHGSEAKITSTGGTFQLSKSPTVYGHVHAVGDAQLSNSVEVHRETVIDETGSYTEISGGDGASHYHGLVSTTGDADVNKQPTFGSDLVVGGSLLNFDGTVHGDLHVHGDADDASADGEIHGDVYVAGSQELTNASGLTIHGTVYDGSDPEGLRDPAQPEVNVTEPDVNVSDRVAELQADNDNAGQDDVDAGGATLQNCDKTCTLTAGDYYLSELVVDGYKGHSLELNTTEGPINIGVDGPVDLTNGQVDLVYDENEQYPVRIYATGDWSQWSDDGSKIDISDDRAQLMQVYMPADSTFTLDGNSEFRGVVYGLSDGTDRTEIYLKGNSGAAFYGAVMGNIQTFDRDLGYHYDESLANGRFVGGGAPPATTDTVVVEYEEADVGYLHVEHRRVDAE